MLALGCSVGVGEGQITSEIHDPECERDGRTVEMNPDFFAADPNEGALEVRVQRGGDFEFMSDGLSIYLADAAAEAMRAGTPIALRAEDDRPVRVLLYLHDTCGFDRDRPPPVYVADAGEITFSNVYAPDLDDDQLETAATFTGVRFVDTSRPDERYVIADGEFSFLFNRGRPAQRFP